MNDLPMNSEEGEKDPLGPMKALTGPYLRMGMPGIWRPRIKAVSGHDSFCFHLMSRLCDGLAFLDEVEPSGAS